MRTSRQLTSDNFPETGAPGDECVPRCTRSGRVRTRQYEDGALGSARAPHDSAVHGAHPSHAGQPSSLSSAMLTIAAPAPRQAERVAPGGSSREAWWACAMRGGARGRACRRIARAGARGGARARARTRPSPPAEFMSRIEPQRAIWIDNNSLGLNLAEF
jgi:hypothetical protein